MDTIDSNGFVLGPRRRVGDLISVQVRRVVADVDAAADVGFTIAEFFAQLLVMQLQQILDGFPLIFRTAWDVNRTSGDVSSSPSLLTRLPPPVAEE